MKNNILNSSDGSVLFAIITAIVISFTVGSLTLLTSNQCIMIEKEIIRKTTSYWLRAGFEYANYKLRNGLVVPAKGITLTLPADPDNKYAITIKIEPDTLDKLSDYKITVSTAY